jgi:hypothetical protein
VLVRSLTVCFNQHSVVKVLDFVWGLTMKTIVKDCTDINGRSDSLQCLAEVESMRIKYELAWC